ncbi:MAG: hypothetical protein KGD64_13485 [Candidatus Heimdallarchaeota archaeon]|nr:hypothetical protein [Candidatus Heimdallarchaeota archaeon]
MAKKSLRQRIFFFEQLENFRKKNHNQLKERIDVHKRNISYILSGFFKKEEYIEAVSEGFLNFKEFREKTGFSHYSNYKKKLASGFFTRKEWEEALEKGFESKDESNLARRVKINHKAELVNLFTKELQEAKDGMILLEVEIRSFQKLISAEFDKKRLQGYKSEIIVKQNLLEKMSEMNKTLHVIEHDDFALMLLIFENKRLKLLQDISKHLDWIETRFPYLEKWNKVLDVINSFRSKIPVQLDRIAELAELDQSEVEQLLIGIVSEIPSVGEYLQREQVFIKKTKSEDDLVSLLAEMKQRQNAEARHLYKRYCLNCGFEIASDDLQTSSKCAKCNELIPTCYICRGHLYKGDDVLIEENCGSPFHKRHILEWVNVRGICPICKVRINTKSLKKIDRSA